MLGCTSAHFLQAVSNDQKSAVHRTVILVRLRGVYRVYSANWAPICPARRERADRPSWSAMYLIDVTSETTRR